MRVTGRQDCFSIASIFSTATVVVSGVLSGWTFAGSQVSAGLVNPRLDGLVEMKSDNVANSPEDIAAQSLINRARLYPGDNEPSLEVSVNAYPRQILRAASLVSVEGGAQLNFTSIPKSEHLEFYLPNGKASHVVLQNLLVAYGVGGELEYVQFNDEVKDAESVHVVGAVEKALRVLFTEKPGIAKAISDNSLALVNARSDRIELTIYRDDESLTPLIEVVVYETGVPDIRVLDSSLLQLMSLDRSDDEDVLNHLKVIALVEYSPGRVSVVVASDLNSVIDSVKTDGVVRSKIHMLGCGGEAVWGREVQTPGKYISHAGYEGRLFTMGFGKSFFELEASSGSAVLVAIQKFLLEPNSTLPDIKTIKIVLPKGQYNELIQAKGSDTYVRVSSELERANMPSLDKLIKDRRIFSVSAGSSLVNYITGSLGSAVVSGVVGGAISTGLNIYNKYQDEGRLPSNYSEDDIQDLATSVTYDAGRHAATGLAVYNMQYLMLMPAFVAATLVGAGNHVYDKVRNGTLDWTNAPAVIVGAGAESFVSGVSGLVGSYVASSVPLVNRIPGASLSGALTGSLVGHYAYQYALNHGLPRKASTLAE